MSNRKESTPPERGRELQDFLTKSLDNLRGSPEERESYPALDRLLARIEARGHRLPALATSSPWRWLRPVLPPLSAATAGFAGAALALILLPPTWLARGVDSQGNANVAVGTAAGTADLGDQELRLAQALRRLERAVRGLEKFQPLVESRIEWIEDALQRKHADAYASVEEKVRAGGGADTPRTSKHNGV